MMDIDEEAFFQETPNGDNTSWQLTPYERALLKTKLTLIGVGLLFMFLVLTASNFTFDSRDATDFSMELAGFQGLNATTLGGHTVSPRFRLKVHVENHHIVVQPAELTVIPWGREVGLSEDLRRRLVSDLHMGTARVKVEMKVFYDDKGDSSAERRDGPVLKSLELMVNRHKEDSM